MDVNVRLSVCLSILLPRAYMSPSVLFQVLLGEVNAGLNTTQVVVKELKASASVQDQMHFLEEAQPYRYAFIVSPVCLSMMGTHSLTTHPHT